MVVLVFGDEIPVPAPEVEHKVCHKCGVDKPASEFFPSRYTRDRLQGVCKVCEREYKRRWYAAKGPVVQKRCAKAREYSREYNRKMRGYSGRPWVRKEQP